MFCTSIRATSVFSSCVSPFWHDRGLVLLRYKVSFFRTVPPNSITSVAITYRHRRAMGIAKRAAVSDLLFETGMEASTEADWKFKGAMIRREDLDTKDYLHVPLIRRLACSFRGFTSHVKCDYRLVGLVTGNLCESRHDL